MPNHLTTQSDESGADRDAGPSLWETLPDNILLMIFTCLKPHSLLRVAQVCHQWHRVGRDELLWKSVFYECWSIPSAVPRAPGKSSWLEEYKRLHYHTPCVESETISNHRDQVLHVTFSNNGRMFSSCSKDGYVKVWNASYPVSLLCYADMKQLTWKYTQFSQFNETDELLLVSGVHFGTQSTSGEIAVYNLTGGKFELQCRVLNKPYDVFGTWYNSEYLLSGNIHWRGNYMSCSVLWLNKASQALESQHESVVTSLYRFLNVNASSIRTVMVAECQNEALCLQADTQEESVSDGSPAKVGESSAGVGHCTVPDTSLAKPRSEAGPIGDVYDKWYQESFEDKDKKAETAGATSQNISPSTSEVQSSEYSSQSTRSSSLSDSSTSSNNTASASSNNQTCSECDTQRTEIGLKNKYLIFTMGTKTYTPHQIGIKLMPAQESTEKIEAMLRKKKLRRRRAPWRRTSQSVPQEAGPNPDGVEPNLAGPDLHPERVEFHPEGAELHPHGANVEQPWLQDDPSDMSEDEAPVEFVDPPFEDEELDSVDHLIELHGHIIGMCLSPDHRYLYVNSRPWPQGYDISDPLAPPPIAQEIDIHVIDLLTMSEVGTMHRAHKAFTPNDECFFIFLDVSKEYVASGAENKNGYVWDRHYGVCVAKYPHTDVVNCVTFNPRDQEMLITASDDHKLKVWRSRARQREIYRQHPRLKMSDFSLRSEQTGIQKEDILGEEIFDP